MSEVITGDERGYVASQVRARTSAGYGAFSRRFEFQTSPYCESGPPHPHAEAPSAADGRVCVSDSNSPLSSVTATSERAQASIVAVAITLALVLLAVVAGFLLSGR